MVQMNLLTKQKKRHRFMGAKGEGVGEGRSVKVCVFITVAWPSRVKNSFMLFPRSVLACGFS